MVALQEFNSSRNAQQGHTLVLHTLALKVELHEFIQNEAESDDRNLPSPLDSILEAVLTVSPNRQ